MKKNNVKGYAILGILFVLVSVIAFAVPTEKTGTFWIAYTFTVVAFAEQIFVWKSALGKENTLKSKFLGIPVVHTGVVYLILQMIAFAVFMFVPTLPVWSAIVACAVIAGVSAICMIAADTGRGEIERIEARAREKVFYIKELQADIELLAGKESDKETKTALEQLAEKICFSDPMSSERLEDLESRIAEKVAELKMATRKTEIIAEVNSLVDERNKRCKILK